MLTVAQPQVEDDIWRPESSKQDRLEVLELRIVHGTNFAGTTSEYWKNIDDYFLRASVESVPNSSQQYVNCETTCLCVDQGFMCCLIR